MERNRSINISDIEDVKFLRSIITELRSHADSDLDTFSSDYSSSIDRFDRESDEYCMSVASSLEVTWRPSSDVNHPFKHIDKISLNWRPQYGLMNLEFRYTPPSGGRNAQSTWSARYDIGLDSEWRNEFNLVKRDFYNLYKKIKLWQDVEVPKRDRERLINAVCEALPNILDQILLGGSSEKA